MNSDRYLGELAGLRAARAMLALGLLAMIGFGALNTWLLSRALDASRTHLVPMTTSNDLWVSENDASDHYLTATARYIVGLAADYTPGTIRRQADELLRLYPAERYGSAREALVSLVRRIEKSGRIATDFALDAVSVARAKDGAGALEARGTRSRYADGRRLTRSVVTYRIEYRIRNGRFELLHLSVPEDEDAEDAQ